MRASLINVPATAPSDTIVDLLRQHGAIIVEQLLDDDVLVRLNREIDPYLGKSCALATEVMTHPVLRAICDAVLLPSCACYQLNLAHVLDRAPGAERART